MNNPKTGSRSNQKRGRRTNRTSATPRPQEVRPSHSANSEMPTNENSPATAGNRPYPSYLPIDECLFRYSNGFSNAKNAPSGTSGCAKGMIIRGKLRVLPGLDKSSFVTCDRGYFEQDIIVPDMFHRNRALDGDMVYVELLNGVLPKPDAKSENADLARFVENIAILDSDKENVDDDEAGDEIAVGWNQGNDDTTKEFVTRATWQDDEMQMDIWNPQVVVTRRELEPRKASAVTIPSLDPSAASQPCGRVVHVVYPKDVSSEIGQKDVTSEKTARRRIVGSLMALQSGTILLTSTNKSLPQFKCVAQNETKELMQEIDRDHDIKQVLFQAEYEYGSWNETHNWPPCTNVKFLGASCVIENEIQALLTENQVDHGDFSASVLKDVDNVVQSGLFVAPGSSELEWKPTPDMYVGRRDYRKQRIFTIDPTTAKDLDDALHITQLPNGLIEIGVHIADVSFFVRPDTAVDEEAIHRATTVYLVDRTVPMLPRPLCEVACSLNENVERLAFSCVWTMNPDGTLRIKGNKDSKQEDVWYGRTIIKSCARLDYATAQNIIDNTVAKSGDNDESVDEELWPISRRPTGGHTMQQVAADVRLMHRVAMARRRLRFENGALALNSTKLTFQLDDDGQTPILAAPYPIRDSNRLIEEYMLLANYLVAQRLITHAGEMACLRHHQPPKIDSMDKVAAVAKASLNFDIDVTSSQSLHESLVRLGQICHDPLVLTCITQMMTLPMQQAKYFAAGTLDQADWRHFALNMPYYTHFTSPIRRYPDIIVHRLLQATLDGEEAVRDMPQDVQDIEQLCVHCSEKQMASKNAQQRCDRVFLSLFIRKNPMKSQMGIVLSVGQKAFTVYLPSIGADAMLYLEEHKSVLTYTAEERGDNARVIVLKNKTNGKAARWKTLDIVVFTKLLVTVVCNDKPPIDIKAKFEGPYL
jgi:DIS3-like exonuclease 2